MEYSNLKFRTLKFPIDRDLPSKDTYKAQNRIQEASVTIDNRTNGGKRRREALVDKPTNALQLIENALNAGINVVFSRYLLLEWERGLFQQMCAEIQDLDYETAIKQYGFDAKFLLRNLSK